MKSAINAVLLVSTLILCQAGTAAEHKGERRNSRQVSLNARTVLDVTNLTSWIEADALWPPMVGESWNGEFPRGSGVGVVFQEGILFGGLVHDGTPPILRVLGSEYSTSMQPGRILRDAGGNVTGAESPADAAVARVWRVRPDYKSADLTADAEAFFQEDSSQVTPEQIQQLRSSYESDWNSWPASKGAPFVDNNHDGVYEPDTDIPGMPDASQTVWLVVNDLAPSDMSPTNSLPIGMEEQITEWTWTTQGVNTPSDIIYKQVKLIYKGTPTSSPDSRIDSLFLAQWSDPDVGDGSNDLVGSDSALSLGYAYNGIQSDLQYQRVNLSPPAVGYQILSGPSYRTGIESDSAIVDFQWTRGYKYSQESLTSLLAQSPPIGLGEDVLPLDQVGEIYNLMRGSLPSPAYPASTPAWTLWTSPGNHPTDFMYFGDPTTRTGWIDSAATDKRMWCSCGPITMQLGDTAEYVIAEVAADGPNYLQNVNVLKWYASWSRFLFTSSISSSVTAITDRGPAEVTWSLEQNYPNPFNPRTLINYQLSKYSRVTLKVFDVLGRELETLVDSNQPAGIHTVAFDGTRLPSGVYFYRINAGDFVSSRKMLLVK